MFWQFSLSEKGLEAPGASQTMSFSEVKRVSKHFMSLKISSVLGETGLEAPGAVQTFILSEAKRVSKH